MKSISNNAALGRVALDGAFTATADEPVLPSHDHARMKCSGYGARKPPNAKMHPRWYEAYECESSAIAAYFFLSISPPAVSLEPDGEVVEPLLVDPAPEGLVLIEPPPDGVVLLVAPLPIEVEEELVLPVDEGAEGAVPVAAGLDGVDGLTAGLPGVLLLDLVSSLLRSHAAKVNAASNATATAPIRGVFIQISARNKKKCFKPVPVGLSSGNYAVQQHTCQTAAFADSLSCADGRTTVNAQVAWKNYGVTVNPTCL